jgi:ribosomal protein L37E
MRRRKIIKETKTYFLGKDNVGKIIECKRCGLRSYDPEHVNSTECPNCGMKWNREEPFETWK